MSGFFFSEVKWLPGLGERKLAKQKKKDHEFIFLDASKRVATLKQSSLRLFDLFDRSNSRNSFQFWIKIASQVKILKKFITKKQLVANWKKMIHQKKCWNVEKFQMPKMLKKNWSKNLSVVLMNEQANRNASRNGIKKWRSTTNEFTMNARRPSALDWPRQTLDANPFRNALK